jgi:hypothetical protein
MYFLSWVNHATKILSVGGGGFIYLQVKLRSIAAFLVAGNILLEAIVGVTGLGRS